MDTLAKNCIENFAMYLKRLNGMDWCSESSKYVMGYIKKRDCPYLNTEIYTPAMSGELAMNGCEYRRRRLEENE